MIKDILKEFDKKFHNSKFSNIRYKKVIMEFIESSLKKVEKANKITIDEFILACYDTKEISGDSAKDLWNKIEKIKENKYNESKKD